MGSPWMAVAVLARTSAPVGCSGRRSAPRRRLVDGPRTKECDADAGSPWLVAGRPPVVRRRGRGAVGRVRRAARWDEEAAVDGGTGARRDRHAEQGRHQAARRGGRLRPRRPDDGPAQRPGCGSTFPCRRARDQGPARPSPHGGPDDPGAPARDRAATHRAGRDGRRGGLAEGRGSPRDRPARRLQAVHRPVRLRQVRRLPLPVQPVRRRRRRQPAVREGRGPGGLRRDQGQVPGAAAVAAVPRAGRGAARRAQRQRGRAVLGDRGSARGLGHRAGRDARRQPRAAPGAGHRLPGRPGRRHAADQGVPAGDPRAGRPHLRAVRLRRRYSGDPRAGRRPVTADLRGASMQYAHLGRTGLRVSRLCLGTMNFGPETSEDDSHAIMDRALDEGINFFDTANVYGWRTGEGVTEQIVGRWFAKGGGRRDKVVLATKVYGSMGEWPNFNRLSAVNVRRACEDSLRRLQTDHIDLYQMHHIDRDTPWDELWQAMDVLVQQGKVVYVGSSNFAGWHIAQANEAARARHSLGLVSEQSLYNLAERSVELEVVPACQAYGLGLIPWSPLYGR